MFLIRRRWAVRVIERMGLHLKSREATELMDMIDRGVSQYTERLRDAGLRASDAERVLMSVAAMSYNKSAYRRLDKAGLDAGQLLAGVRAAGHEICLYYGFDELAVLFHLNDVEANLAAARQMPSDTRKLMVRGLEATCSQIDAESAWEKKARMLALISKYARKRRHDGPQEGSDARNDPVCNATVCIESLARAELVALRSPKVDREVRMIRSAVETFIAENTELSA